MPVIALESHNLHLERPPSPSRKPRSGDPPIPLHASSFSFDSGVAFPSPSPSSPPRPPTPPSTHDADNSSSPTAGPSNHNHHHHQHHPQNHQQHQAIPPPPNPRRHRSGVLMSRVRAHSSGTSWRSNAEGVPVSKSFGDLSMTLGLGMSSMSRGRGNAEDGGSGDKRGFKRVASEGTNRALAQSLGQGGAAEGEEGDEEEDEGSEMDGMSWDNSARFYHHLHSRPPSRPSSRSHSRSTSPARSPVSTSADPSSLSTAPTSPLYVRRSLTLPQSGSITPGNGLSASLSPNHQFLQQHLPPTFPSSPDAPSSDHGGSIGGGSGGGGGLAPPGQGMVILTPTTQEWRELREISRLEGGGDEEGMSSSLSEGSSDLEEDGGNVSMSRRSSNDVAGMGGAMRLHVDGLALPGASGSRPPLKSTKSADFLSREMAHSPDPGSSARLTRLDGTGLEMSPHRPVFHPVIIAPSPVMHGDSTVPVPPDTPTRTANTSSLPTNADNGVAAPQHAKLDASEVVYDEKADYPLADDVDPDQPIDISAWTEADERDSPVRFASFGRRDSLRILHKRPDVGPRVKTKRELERERLFKDLDEELESSPEEAQGAWNGGVQEIGSGGGLGLGGMVHGLRSADASLAHAEKERVGQAGNPFDAHFQGEITKEVEKPTVDLVDKEDEVEKVSGSLPTVPSAATGRLVDRVLSPTQPMRPSPLHATSPLTAGRALHSSTSESSTASNTPAESPLEPPSATTRSPSPQDPYANLDTIRTYAKSLASSQPASRTASPTSSPPKRRRDTNRVSLVAGRVVQPFAIPPSTSLPPGGHAASGGGDGKPSLQSFSPFRSHSPAPALGPQQPSFARFDSTISIAPSTGVPSECGTPTSEAAGGIGGRGIDDYVIQKEAGKGAYGLVMRAKVKGPKGEPVGDEVIIKYIIKARILADCWKKHKSLGPIPVEIHVMDQLRHLPYHPPPFPHPWDPSRPHTSPAEPLTPTSPPQPAKPTITTNAALSPLAAHPSTPLSPDSDGSSSAPATPESVRSASSAAMAPVGAFSSTQKYIASEIQHAPERGHPNICKLLDFFEDREFYYLVMPRFGTGLDLFDRVESSPSGLSAFEIRSLLGQLSDAVRFLHANNIVHRDIKDENVILDGNGRCQLIDFGSAAQWRPGKRWDTFSGTLHYASPEILRGEMYGGKEQDVWALGVVGYVLLVGETPFSQLPDEVLEGLHGESRAEAALEERCGGEHADEGVEADGGGRLGDAADLVRRCLEMDVSDRPSAEMVCQHRYLKGESGWVGERGWVGLAFK